MHQWETTQAGKRRNVEVYCLGPWKLPYNQKMHEASVSWRDAGRPARPKVLLASHGSRAQRQQEPTPMVFM